MRTSSRCTRIFALAAALAALTACTAAINPASIEAARTAARVKTALVNDSLIGTRVIDVRVDGTTVRLSGLVRTQEEADRAVSVARLISGVTAVESQLRIDAGPAPPPDSLVPPPDPARGAAYEFAELEKGPSMLALGAGVGWTNPGGSGYGHAFSISPLIRLGSGAGLSPSIAFDWFGTTLVAAPAPVVDTGNVRVKPLMAGVGYNVPIGRVLVTPSLVAGYAFNRLRLPDDGVVEGMPVGIDHSFAWRPGIAIWIDAGRRISLNVSLGRVMTSPRVTFVEDSQFRIRTLSADTTILSVGLAYTLF
jgi:hypothetical protein